jgi:hypothetical protein
MENTDKKLSFPQRNWFLLCVLVAILSPLVVHWIQIGAHKESYKQSVDIKSKDSSYKITNPPGNDSASKAGNTTTDSASK